MRDALEVIRPSYMRGHRQRTGVARLALTTRMGGRRATFDGTIPLGAVVGATAATLAVIGTVRE